MSPEDPTRSWAILTPFALPNELIRVRIRQASRLFSKSDLVEVVERNDSLRLLDEEIKCKYFGKWSAPVSKPGEGAGAGED
jgi:tRNA/tmRNA/rRNA uracil-C5-methylase (TrmA/RlmC/RlmD family)